MTPEDRELLQTIRRQQLELQRSLARLDFQIEQIESRSQAEPVVEPPPFVPIPDEPPPLPSVPEASPEFPAFPPPVNLSAEAFPPLPEHPPAPAAEFPPLPETVAPVFYAPPIPPPPPAPSAPQPSFELRLGFWLIRLSAVFFVIALVIADSYFKLHHLLGPWGKIGLGGLISVLVTFLGQRLERKGDNLLFIARTLIAAGLAGLYVTLYAACSYKPMEVIHNPYLAGILLLSWSAYVFYLSEQRRAQSLALFAVTLAYFSTAINPIGYFSMAADLILAVTGVVFLIRNGWTALSYFSLAGTYYALFRRLVVDDNGDIALDYGHPIHFWPYATYLTGAWLIFTAAVMLSTSPDFRGGKRLAFLSLNNGMFTGLLLLTQFISGHGHVPMGWALLLIGLALLVISRLAGWVRVEPEHVMRA